MNGQSLAGLDAPMRNVGSSRKSFTFPAASANSRYCPSSLPICQSQGEVAAGQVIAPSQTAKKYAGKNFMLLQLLSALRDVVFVKPARAEHDFLRHFFTVQNFQRGVNRFRAAGGILKRHVQNPLPDRKSVV